MSHGKIVVEHLFKVFGPDPKQAIRLLEQGHDKDRILAYVNRLVPPQYSEQARLFETSVSTSFGGFIRGQFIQGLVFGTYAVLAHLVLGLDFMPASAALVGVLQAIPFFGPIVSWAPPSLLTRRIAPAPGAVKYTWVSSTTSSCGAAAVVTTAGAPPVRATRRTSPPRSDQYTYASSTATYVGRPS